jgi:hypothetical protein
MGRFKNLVLAPTVILLLFSVGCSYQPDSVEPGRVNADHFQAFDLLGDRSDLTTNFFSDNIFNSLTEFDSGRVFFLPVLFGEPINKSYVAVAAGISALKAAELMTPALNGCKLIFPFHSFF